MLKWEKIKVDSYVLLGWKRCEGIVEVALDYASTSLS